MNDTSRKEELQSSVSDIRIFISHSARDQGIAEALTELLKNSLEINPKSIRCTSVPGYGLRGGARADDELRQELLRTSCFIGLLTPDSLKSTYVLFELGARWGADLHLLPLLASGLQPKHLKGPLTGINAHSCSSEAQLHQMIDELAELLRLNKRPTQHYLSYISKLQEMSSEGESRLRITSREIHVLYAETVAWQVYPDGGLAGPLCPKCWEQKGELIRLISGNVKGTYHCESCKTDGFRTGEYQGPLATKAG